MIRSEISAFTDHVVFGEVLERDPSIMVDLVNLFSGLNLVGFKVVQKEKETDTAVDTHGMRFDVYGLTSDNRQILLEMQCYRDQNLPLRCRY